VGAVPPPVDQAAPPGARVSEPCPCGPVIECLVVLSGWGGWLEGFAPGLFEAPRGQALFALALR
jgi:hypothetical protein